MGFLDEILKKEEPKEENKGDAREEPREETREEPREEGQKPSRSVFSYGEEFKRRYGA